MKKTEMKEVKEVKEIKEMKAEEAKKERVMKPRTNEMTQLNAMSKRLRMAAWRFVRRIQGSNDAEALMARLDEAYSKVEEAILEMTNEQMMAFRFANLNEAERAYLKKMLDNYDK